MFNLVWIADIQMVFLLSHRSKHYDSLIHISVRTHRILYYIHKIFHATHHAP